MNAQNKIKQFVEKNYVRGAGQVTAETSLLDSGLIDSTAILELVGFIETEFGIQVRDEEIVPEHFETIGNITSFIESKRAA